MPPYRASVVGPASASPLLRILALLLLVPAVVSLIACGGGGSTTKTTVGPSPAFTSKPPTAAREGVLFTYDVTTTTSDNSTVTYTVTSGTGGAFDGNTFKWTPTHAQSRTANTFTITATTSNNGTATQSFSVTPNGNIDGTAIDHAVTGTGLANYPEDLSGSVVEALVPNGTGGYNVIKGSGDSSGNFSVPNLSPASFLLHIQQPYNGTLHDNYIWTNASDIDAGRLLCCRPDATPISAGQTVHTNVTLSVAPTANDMWSFTSSDANAYTGMFPATTNPLIASVNQHGGLIDSSKGDRAFLVHYAADSNSTKYIVEAKEYDSLTQSDGGTTNLTGTLNAVGGSTTDPVIKITQFDAVLSGLTNGGSITRSFTLQDVGYAGTEGGGTGVTLISANLNGTSADTDLGSLSYGLVSSSGVPYYLFQDLGTRTVSVNTGVSSSTFNFAVGSTILSNSIPTASTSIVPVISAPRSVTVDGKAFLNTQTGISLTPQIAWNPPATGTPTSYQLTVLNAAAPASDVHYFYTNGNSVNIPSGLLQAGTTYLFVLQAQVSQANTFTKAPFRTGTSLATTTVASSAITTGSAGAAQPLAASVQPRKYRITPNLGGGIIVTTP